MRAVQLLCTIGGSTAQPGDVIEVEDKRAAELVAGREAVYIGQPKPADTDPDTAFAKSLKGTTPTPVDKGEV